MSLEVPKGPGAERRAEILAMREKSKFFERELRDASNEEFVQFLQNPTFSEEFTAAEQEKLRGLFGRVSGVEYVELPEPKRIECVTKKIENLVTENPKDAFLSSILKSLQSLHRPLRYIDDFELSVTGADARRDWERALPKPIENKITNVLIGKSSVSGLLKPALATRKDLQIKDDFNDLYSAYAALEERYFIRDEDGNDAYTTLPIEVEDEDQMDKKKLITDMIQKLTALAERAVGVYTQK